MRKMIVLLACAAVICACGGSSPKPTEESKSLPASSLVLKGKHAKLFKLADDSYSVHLVKAGDNDWQVRVKMTIANQTPFNQIRDYKNYERDLVGPFGVLLNSSDVELESLDMNGGDWEDLIQEDDEQAQATISAKTWSYKKLGYESAKELFDKTVAVQISGIELKPVTKKANKLIDDETQDAIDDMKELLETEGEMLNALKGLF